MRSIYFEAPRKQSITTPHPYEFPEFIWILSISYQSVIPLPYLIHPDSSPLRPLTSSPHCVTTWSAFPPPLRSASSPKPPSHLAFPPSRFLRVLLILSPPRSAIPPRRLGASHPVALAPHIPSPWRLTSHRLGASHPVALAPHIPSPWRLTSRRLGASHPVALAPHIPSPWRLTSRRLGASHPVALAPHIPSPWRLTSRRLGASHPVALAPHIPSPWRLTSRRLGASHPVALAPHIPSPWRLTSRRLGASHPVALALFLLFACAPTYILTDPRQYLLSSIPFPPRSGLPPRRLCANEVSRLSAVRPTPHRGLPPLSPFRL
ncbi:unnamed protein product [Closterium sp. Yama58-4]|nr:unnamed protein product [Closterium sp. Yama58-4]